MTQPLQFPTVLSHFGNFYQKTSALRTISLFSLFFLMLSSTNLAAQDVAFCGWDGVGGDEFTFVLLRDHAAGEIIYFTEEDYSDAANGFDTGEGHLAYTVPAGGLTENTVILITETGVDAYTVTGGGSATHVAGTGGWSFSESDELYAYSSNTPAAPWGDVDEMHCFAYFQNFALSGQPDQDPSSDFPNCIILDFSPSPGNGTYNFNDPSRVNTTLADLQNPANWTNSGITDITLSTTNFTNQMIVSAGPTVTFTAPADLCIDAVVQTGLSGGLPTGGTYSGSGVTDDGNGMTYTFDPATAGVGVHTITYTFTDGTGTGMATDDVEVFALPVVTFTALADLCVNAGVQAGLGGGSPVGGLYSGIGVTNDGNGMTYSFDPAAAGVGTFTLTYTFTDANGCINSASDDVEVLNVPTINSTPNFGAVCANFMSNGFGNFTPTGGVYSGPGVTDDGNGTTFTFDASNAAIGDNDIMYTVTVNGCTSTSISNFTVNALPTVTFTAPADLCVNAGVQAGLSGGLPTGGTYSGSGVTDDGNGMTYSFDPAAAGVGTSSLTYTFTDGNGCTGSASDMVEVFALPIVTMTVAGTGTCITAGVQASKSGGTPTGGVYSGSGVTDDNNGMTYTFDPAVAGVGSTTVTYTFTDVNGCTNSATDDEIVFPVGAASFTALADLCISAGIQSNLSGGSPTGGFYSGAGVTDDGNGMTYSFNPVIAGEGITTITYTVGSGDCAGIAMDDVEVFGLPSVMFDGTGSGTGTGTCFDAGIQLNQTGGTPVGGVYSGPGVTDDSNGMTYTFDPAAAGVGSAVVMYEVTDANGCSNVANLNREVFPLPNVTFAITGTGTCIDAGVMTGLSGGAPQPEITRWDLDAGVTLEDGAIVTGFFEYAPGATIPTNWSIDVSGGTNAANFPAVTYSPANSNTTLSSATLVIFDFNDLSGGPFPSTRQIRFFTGSSFLTSSGTMVPLDLSDPNDNVECFTCSPFRLVTAGTVSGGNLSTGFYSGPGVTDDGNGMTYSFDPAAAGVGVHILTYTYTDENGCTNSATDNFEVYDLPTVIFTAPADVCVDDGVQAGLGGGTPPQGTATGDLGVYSGDGVTDDGNGMTYSFDPAVAGLGTHTLTYTYTDENGCTNSASDDIEVLAPPVVSLSTALYYCVDAPIQNVTLTGGSPEGGVYSGPGVTDNGMGTGYFLDPTINGPGTVTVTYTVTLGNGCSDFATSDIDITECDFELTDPCACLDNATIIDLDNGTGGDDGQFSELVSIIDANGMLPAGQIWTVASATGAFDAYNIPPLGTQSAGVPVAAGETFTYNAGLGTYELPFVHVEEQGYSIIIEGPFGQGSPANVSLTIGNNCAYTDPVFFPALPSEIQDDDPPITLGGFDAYGHGTESISFTIDGTPATVFDPSTLAEGDRLVVMTLDGGTDNRGGISPDGGTTPAHQGCIQSVQQVIEVIICNAPVLTCPADNFGLPPGCNPTVPTATTNFNVAGGATPNPAWPTVSADPCFPLVLTANDVTTDVGCTRTVTRTYTITDDRGQMDQCTQTFTFTVDTEMPTFSAIAPSPITVECDAVPAPAAITATDNCPSFNPVLFINEFHYDNTGTDVGEFIEVAGSAGFDLSNCELVLYNGSNSMTYNTTALSGTIDDEGNGFGALSFAYAPNGIQNGNPDGIALVCDGAVLQFISYEGTITAVGGPADGMTSTDIGVSEPGAVGESLQLMGMGGCASSDFAWFSPMAESPGTINSGQTFDLTACPADNNVAVVFTEVRTDGTCANEYTLTRTFTATDGCGNVATQVQTINVIDTTAPAFCEDLPMAAITLECDEDVPPAATLTATDNCDLSGFTQTVWINEIHYDNSGGDVGEFIEIAGIAGTDLMNYELQLYNGNGGALDATVMLMGIIDNEDCNLGAVSFAITGIMNGSPDGVALVDRRDDSVVEFLSWEGTFTAVNGAAIGMTSTDIGVAEGSGTQIGESLQQIGAGFDVTNFTWSGPSAESPGDLNEGQTAQGNLAVMFDEVTTPGACPQESVITRTWSVSDACGNGPTVHTQVITIQDTQAPEVTCTDFTDTFEGCPDDIFPNTPNGDWILVGADGGFTAAAGGSFTIPVDLVCVSDNCSALANLEFTLTASYEENRSACSVTIVNEFSIRDECGNVSATPVITRHTIEDTTPPVITCPADVTIECDEDDTPANTGMATATDQCSDPAITFNDVITPTDCPQEYTITRTWTATDDCGNPTSCDQIIIVEDTTAPEPVCNTIRIFLSASGQYTLTQADIDAIALGSSDNCDDDFTYMVDQTFFDCSDIDLMIGAIGGAEIELTVTDCAGNSDVCTAIVEIDDAAVPFDFGCIGDLNVTLGANCSATITPDMVVTGFDDCIDSYNLMVDGLDSDQAVGCGEHTYMIEMIEDGEIVYTCWGSIFAEDKTNPVVDCPDNTDNVDVEFDLQTLDGSIDGTEPSINLADYSCFQSFFEPADGVAYNYDLITFTVDPDLPETDVYNIQTISNIPGLNIALFQGAFNEDNPCENILGGSEGAYFVDPVFGVNAFFDQNFRIELALQPGQTYTLFVANTSFGTTGDYTVGIVSDNGGTFENSGFSAPQPVVANLPLYCEDLNLVEVTEPMTYMVSANGDIMPGTLSAELTAILNLTGYPDVTDNCGPVLVTVTDDVNENGDCGSIVITRTFLVSDRADGICTGAPRTAICTQLITLNRPDVFDLVLPPYTAALECDENFATDGSVGGPDDNPAASATGYPFLLTAQGYVDLSQTYCNLGANYSDEPRINVCEGSYKFRREWNIIDWCSPSDNVIWQQYVKVGDFTGPNILNSPDNIDISTSPFSCVANIAIPALDVIDDNGCSEAFATTYTILAFGDTFFATGNIDDGDVVSAPIGVHTLIRCAEDDCGNETCVETTLTITDQIEPSAACNDELNVSIGGGDVLNGIEGIARIFATDVDEGSYDNCGEVTLEVRRNYWRDNTCDPSPNRFSPWGDFVDFYCCDIDNEITIELRVTDESGNQNICWMVITPEDKLIPFCYAPDDVDLDCDDLPLTFPGNIEDAYDDDFNGTSVMMTALFGGASGTDNCAVDTIIERTPNIQVNECGWGTITRRFEAWQVRPEGDVNGNGAIDIGEVFRSNNSCFQVITVNEVHDFEIDFPEDAAADCGDPDVPEIITTATGCDVLSVNVGAPVLFSATGDECYKYSITYDVINWCVWDGEYEGLRLPRITEDDGEDLPIDRAVEGNERPVVSVVSSVGPVDNDCDGIADAGGDDIQYTVVIDRRHTDREGDSSIPNTVYDNIPGNGIPCIPADQFGRRNFGRYVYTQFVKVYDSTAPVVTVGDFGGPTDNCPDLAPGQFGDDDGNCEEAVSIPFSVSDECELFDGDGVLVVEIVSAELDAFAVDANNDGDIKANEFVAEAGSDGDVLSNITDNGDGTYSFDGTYPIIPAAMGDNVYHAVRILFRDGCGNLTSRIIVFDVIDCKGPAPICINGLTVTLMPQDDGGCAMAIWANDFEASPIDDCTGQGPDLGPSGLPRVTNYAIYRAEDAQVPGFEPNPIVTGLVLTEEDEGEVVVYIYAFDEEGNYNYCETYLLVQQHTMCDDGSNTAMIAGVIATEFDETVEGVEVSINGEMTDVMMTATDGAYSFSNLPLGGDYSVTPYLNANPLNGVTTFDLVKISKHILNVELLDSPYKMIAADANRSNTVTTLDMIQIRKLILNVITEFPNNTSWRFVETAYAFPEVTNPWYETFPELISENNLAGDVLDADFVGVKIGDVNGSAQANALASDDRNLNGIFHLQAEDIDLKAGNTYTVAVTADDLSAIEGYQGTLQLSGVELVDIEYGMATAEHFGMRYAAEGQITMSWNHSSSGRGGLTSVSHNDVLFSLVLRATADQSLREALSISSRYTAAEAYRAGELTDLGITFSGRDAWQSAFTLYQNTPNPFEAATLIGFNLPEDATATVTINDVSGRVLTVIKGDYAAGYNTVNVTKQMIQGATGVLSYTIEAGDYTATKQMIVVK